MYVYKRTEPGLWTVGYYDPKGKWEPESDHGSTEEAAKRTAWLNGDRDAPCEHPGCDMPAYTRSHFHATGSARAKEAAK